MYLNNHNICKQKKRKKKSLGFVYTTTKKILHGLPLMIQSCDDDNVLTNELILNHKKYVYVIIESLQHETFLLNILAHNGWYSFLTKRLQ